MKHTKEPWGWQNMGKWCLVGQHGMRPIVLSVNPKGELTSRDSERDLLVPFNPEHPDAERIVACVNACAGINPEAVPEMLKALKAVVNANVRDGCQSKEDDYARKIIAKAEKKQ